MTKIIRIDSRVIGFSDEPIRILAVCMVETGHIKISKKEIFTNLPVAAEHRESTVVVTDAPQQVQQWQLSFNSKDHLENVITVYQMRDRAGLIKIDASLSQYNPKNVLQVRKVDKNGLQQEFDSSSLNNGHLAVLLAVWASNRMALSHSITDGKIDADTVDTTMLPFSI